MHGGRQLAFLSLLLPCAEMKIIYHKLHGISILSGIINTIYVLISVYCFSSANYKIGFTYLQH